MASTPPHAHPLLIGIDVGTGSARAGVFDAQGRLLASAERPIRIYRVEGQPLLYQQSSADIWGALSAAVGEAVAVASAGGDADVASRVVGLSVTATCSMVVVRGEGGDEPADVTPVGATATRPPGDGDDVPNIIMWLDHRALAEAEASVYVIIFKPCVRGFSHPFTLDAHPPLARTVSHTRPSRPQPTPCCATSAGPSRPKTRCVVCSYVLNTIGIETESNVCAGYSWDRNWERIGVKPSVSFFQTKQQQNMKQVPKLLWIKHHLPDLYHDPTTRYFDLADYLSLRLTGAVGGQGKGKDEVRSLCCVGAKWMYDTEAGRW